MYHNIGTKICTLAKILCWVGIGFSFVLSVVMCVISFGNILLILSGIGGLVVGCLLSWVGSFVLYGYGKMINEVTMTRQETQKANQLLEKILTLGSRPSERAIVNVSNLRNLQNNVSSHHSIRCRYCGAVNTAGSAYCSKCKRKL